MHRTYVGRLERGESGVTVEALAAILAALGVTIRRLLLAVYKGGETADTEASVARFLPTTYGV